MATYVWICPKCEYRISQIEFYSVRYDYSCPKCKVTPLSHFNKKKIESEASEGE